MKLKLGDTVEIVKSLTNEYIGKTGKIIWISLNEKTIELDTNKGHLVDVANVSRKVDFTSLIPGNYYKTRNGLKYKCLAIDTKTDQKYNNIGELFFNDSIKSSIVFHDCNGIHINNDDLDIISECIDFDWDSMPKWANYIWFDKSGRWKWSMEKPKYSESGDMFYFDKIQRYMGIIPDEFSPGKWETESIQNSLYCRE